MEGGRFLGRSRPIWKVVLYSLLSFGVYGRVLLYKSVKEVDGHEVLFLDLPLYRLGVIAPVIGPFVVKRRLALLVDELTRDEVTLSKVHTTGLTWAALLPWIPLFHALTQRHLNAYWKLQRRLDDIESRRDTVQQLKGTAATDEDKAKLKQMQADLRERERILEDAREAAIAIRDAERARERARAQAGVRKRKRPAIGRYVNPKTWFDALMVRLRARLEAKGDEQEVLDEDPEPVRAEEAPSAKKPKAKPSKAEEPPAAAQEAVPSPAPEPVAESKRSRFGFLKRASKDEQGAQEAEEVAEAAEAEADAGQAGRKRRFSLPSFGKKKEEAVEEEEQADAPAPKASRRQPRQEAKAAPEPAAKDEPSKAKDEAARPQKPPKPQKPEKPREPDPEWLAEYEAYTIRDRKTILSRKESKLLEEFEKYRDRRERREERAREREYQRLVKRAEKERNEAAGGGAKRKFGLGRKKSQGEDEAEAAEDLPPVSVERPEKPDGPPMRSRKERKTIREMAKARQKRLKREARRQARAQKRQAKAHAESGADESATPSRATSKPRQQDTAHNAGPKKTKRAANSRSSKPTKARKP